MNMPASEFVQWRAYFSIFPFSEDRADIRNAELISWLTYISSLASRGKGLKTKIPAKEILYDYLSAAQGPKEYKPKSREQQRAEFEAFVSKHQKMVLEAQGKKQS